MFRAPYIIMALLSLTLFSGGMAYAQILNGKFKNWALFTTKEGSKNVCYITSNPIKKTGDYKHRGDVYIIVTYRGAGTTPEVSVSSGFPFKKDAEVSFAVDKKPVMMLFTSEETPEMAWAKSEKDDTTLVGMMKNGNNVIVNEVSSKGTKAQDTYSLNGFTDSYNKMISNCK